jgi:high-affinity iron transporter
MLAGFLLSLREGLEAALVIGMVLGLLYKLKRTDLNWIVWSGMAVAAVLSVVVALVLILLGMEFEGLGEMIFEGSAMLLAAGVLSWMILWVHRSAGNTKGEIEAKTHTALRAQTGNGLFLLAFLAVFREGIELALFLLAVEKASTPLQTLAGALTGLAGAALLGWVLFSSTRKLNLRGFFKVTNILLIIFAAGMVAVGVHEFNEAGIIPALINPVWDISSFLSNNSELGMLLKALIGYNATPSLSELLAYGVYLIGVTVYIFARKPKQVATAVGAAG